jgi:hypothetical protein
MREDSTPSTFRDAVAVVAMLAVVIAIIIGLVYLLAPTTGHGPRPAHLSRIALEIVAP